MVIIIPVLRVICPLNSLSLPNPQSSLAVPEHYREVIVLTQIKFVKQVSRQHTEYLFFLANVSSDYALFRKDCMFLWYNFWPEIV